MSPDLCKGRCLPRAMPVTGAALALVGLLVLGSPAAAALAPADVETVTAEGTLVQLVVEHPEGSPSAALEVRSVVEVGTVMLTMPAELPDVVGSTGDNVTVVMEALPGLSLAEALGEAAVPEAGDLARVVEVLEESAPATAKVGEEELAAAAIGVHRLVVLPVYWTAPDSATVTTLQGAATRTADYWSEQSGGRIAVQTEVRGWAQISDPGGCDVETIWSRALAAHGITSVPSNQHLLVYFPHQDSCGGWAGMASLGGGRLWVNGWTLTDVWAHELGHNFGLGHANRATCTSASTRVSLALPISGCTATEYADRADVMGIALNVATGNLNTAMADYLGLATVVRPAPGVTTIVDLQPLASVDAVRSVAVDVAGGTVYVDFRPATGRDVRMPAWAGVQVHLRTTDAGGGVPTTYLLDMVPGTVNPFTSPALPAGAAWAVPGTTQIVTVTQVGATATVSVGPRAVVSPGVAAYVSMVYRQLFDRDVDPVGLATWSGALAAGTPRVAVANAITSSDEYRSSLISGSYATFLGRLPDAAGLSFWLAHMRGGMTIQAMEAGFLASDEYFAQAGSSDAVWVAHLYGHVLGRGAAQSEIDFWTGRLRAGSTRNSVALGFLLSTEHLTTIVDAEYHRLLNRGIDPTGTQTWVGQLQRSVRFEQVIGSIIASDEYFLKSQG